MKRLFACAALVAAIASSVPELARSQDYFVPNAPRPQTVRPTPAQRPPAAPPRSRPNPPVPTPQAGAVNAPDQENVPQVQLPPVPELPALPKAPPPPAAVIGVLGVPEVMRASTAAQLVDRVVGQRREKLNQDAQQEQAAWRDLQQQLSAQRSTMSPDQIRAKEHELQDRITNAQKQFRDRNRIIQEAAQYGVGQIERMLVAVIRQVSESHGMNLVLHRAQVALNVNEFDITDQVTAQLNKIMPTVTIPPDGVEPAMVSAPGGAAPPGPPLTPAGTPDAAPAPAVAPGPRR